MSAIDPCRSAFELSVCLQGEVPIWDEVAERYDEDHMDRRWLDFVAGWIAHCDYCKEEDRKFFAGFGDTPTEALVADALEAKEKP